MIIVRFVEAIYRVTNGNCSACEVRGQPGPGNAQTSRHPFACAAFPSPYVGNVGNLCQPTPRRYLQKHMPCVYIKISSYMFLM